MLNAVESEATVVYARALPPRQDLGMGHSRRWREEAKVEKKAEFGVELSHFSFADGNLSRKKSKKG